MAFREGHCGVGTDPLRFSLACQSFSFLFRGVQREHLSFSGGRRDHDNRRATYLNQRISLTRSRILLTNQGSMSERRN